MRLLTLGFCIGFLVAVAPGCGSSTEGCSAANCAGCCSSEGICLPGNQNVACGYGAQLCDVCGLVSQCLHGACVATPLETGGGAGGGGEPGTGGGTEGTGGGEQATGGGSAGTGGGEQATGGGNAGTGGGEQATGGGSTGTGGGEQATGGGSAGTGGGEQATGGGNAGTGGGSAGTGGGSAGTGGGNAGTGGGNAGTGGGTSSRLWFRGDPTPGQLTALYVQSPPGAPAAQVSAQGLRVKSFSVTDSGTTAVLVYAAISGAGDSMTVLSMPGAVESPLHTAPAGMQLLDPVVSPDGQWVAFTQGSTASGAAGLDLFVTKANGSQAPLQVSPVHPPNTSLQPTLRAFSFDSRYLAFAGDFTTNGTYELHVYDVIGHATNALLTPTNIGASNGVADLGWTAGSAWLIVRAKLGGGVSKLYTCEATGTCVLLPVPGGNVVIDAMGMSADGSKVLYTSNIRGSNYADLYIATSTGAMATRVAQDAPAGRRINAGQLITSPDGAWVAFTANYASADASIWDLYVLPTAGTPSLTPTVSAADATVGFLSLAFSPNSDALAYRADSAVDGRYELFTVAPGQAPTLRQPMPTGSVNDVKWTR